MENDTAAGCTVSYTVLSWHNKGSLLWKEEYVYIYIFNVNSNVTVFRLKL